MSPSAGNRGADVGLLLLRLALGAIMLFHGIFKVTHGVAWIQEMLIVHKLPGFLAYGVYVGEIVAPLLLILGLGARFAAAAMAIDMLVAIGMVLRPRVLTVNPMGGGWAIELEALILFSSLALACTGPGAITIGRLFGRGGASGGSFQAPPAPRIKPAPPKPSAAP